MLRITVMTLALLALVGTAAAQVPYTSSPFPSWQQQQPRRPAYDPYRELQRQLNEPVWNNPAFGFSEPEPERRPRRRRPSISDNVLGDINRSIGQPYQPRESYYDRMMREHRAEMDRTLESHKREVQSRNIERAIRCGRFGSREVYADCHEW